MFRTNRQSHFTAGLTGWGHGAVKQQLGSIFRFDFKKFVHLNNSVPSSSLFFIKVQAIINILAASFTHPRPAPPHGGEPKRSQVHFLLVRSIAKSYP